MHAEGCGMTYKETAEKLAEYRREIAGLRQKMRDAQASIEPEVVKDYEFSAPAGTIRLSALFGDKDTLFVVHNMGRGCRYCTLWADGFSGVYDHLRQRAAFVVSSPDDPATQWKFADSRGWKFPMVSHQGTTFAADMGYRRDSGFRPGVSVFKREGDKLFRVADTSFAPGDDFCSVWHFFALIPEGDAGSRPKLAHADRA
jgi:predicted dithiol-disulfide oxidoreductase (DUF899 family)